MTQNTQLVDWPRGYLGSDGKIHTDKERSAVAPVAPVVSKATNPKDAVGSTKLPLDLVPDTLSAFAAASFAEGASKYGSYNWRVSGVRASIYKAALERHLKKWWNGEDCDAVTKVPHLASVIACAAIILDAGVVGKLNDDRPPKVDLDTVIKGLEETVRHVYSIHAHINPDHKTEANSGTK